MRRFGAWFVLVAALIGMLGHNLIPHHHHQEGTQATHHHPTKAQRHTHHAHHHGHAHAHKHHPSKPAKAAQTHSTEGNHHSVPDHEIDDLYLVKEKSISWESPQQDSQYACLLLALASLHAPTIEDFGLPLPHEHPPALQLKQEIPQRGPPQMA